MLLSFRHQIWRELGRELGRRDEADLDAVRLALVLAPPELAAVRQRTERPLLSLFFRRPAPATRRRAIVRRTIARWQGRVGQAHLYLALKQLTPQGQKVAIIAMVQDGNAKGCRTWEDLAP